MKEVIKKIVHFSVAFVAAFSSSMYASTITTYLQYPPQPLINSIDKELSQETLQKAGKQDPVEFTKKRLSRDVEDVLHQLSGFISLYAGYLDYSNKDGLIVLPLRHKEPKTYIVITPRIVPKKVFSNTIAHVEYELPDIQDPVKIYQLDRKKDDKGDFFWRVKAIERPKDKKINPIAVVLLTLPENIYIREGDHLATDDPNLILPNLYVVGNTEKPHAMLDFLDIKRFFETIEIGRTTKEKLSQEIITND